MEKEHHLKGKIPPNKITFQKVIEEFSSFGIKVLDDGSNYTKVTSKLKLECPSCKKEFFFSLFKIRYKQNKVCESCSRKNPRKLIKAEEAIKEIKSYGGDIIDPPNDWTIDIILTFKCSDCYSTYKRTWKEQQNHNKKCRVKCKSCGINERNKANGKKGLLSLHQITESSGITLLSDDKYYLENKKSIFKCKQCNESFERAHKYLNRESYPNRTDLCSKCSGGRKTSIQEEEVGDFIKSLGEQIISNDRKVLSGKEIDILLPERKLGIEINGLHFHSEFSGGKDKNYHLHKRDEALKSGIKLLQFWDFEVIHKKELVFGMIKNQLGYSKKIGARKTKIKENKAKDVRKFFEENHLAGFANGSSYIGLYIGDELLSCLILGNSRSSKEIEIIRFATKIGYNVVGGFSKIVNYILKNKNIESLISFADKRISTGELYIKSGWREVSNTSPCYWYFKDKKELYHRSNFMKSKLSKKLKSFDESKTEWENMLENGYDRVFDCGNIKYEK